MAGFALAVPWTDRFEKGLQGVVEVQSTDLPRKAHVQDLIDALNTKFRAKGAPRFVQYILLYGTELSRDRAVDAIIPNLMGGPPGLIAETLFSPRLVTVTVKTLTGRRFSLLYPATEDVADIRDEIRFREGIPNEQQRLVLNGRQLEDGRSLADHGVKTECTLQLILKLRGDVGPGLKFADVYYEDTWLVELQLDSKAPDWRTCAEGLNLEGECENDDCEAFGNMVIHQFGFDSFNLMRDHRVPCPNCEKDFKPVTCGFHRCVWKFDGKLSDDGGEMPVARSTIASIRIRLEWDSLLIVAKSRRVAIAAKIPACSRSVAVRKSTVCSICWSTFGSTERNAVSRAQ